jgi:hypothetical protein
MNPLFKNGLFAYVISHNLSDFNREIVATPRINMDFAEEYKDRLWTFFKWY